MLLDCAESQLMEDVIAAESPQKHGVVCLLFLQGTVKVLICSSDLSTTLQVLLAHPPTSAPVPPIGVLGSDAYCWVIWTIDLYY